jgi:hypothetical protein
MLASGQRGGGDRLQVLGAATPLWLGSGSILGGVA